MRRFRVTGFARVVFELLGEAMTLGAAGSVVVLMLALPAFQATKTDWRSQGDYSVTFLDRYGNEIGKRGIRHSDVVPLDEMPDYLIKAVLATEDRRFFEHFGIDVLGTARALVENLRANAVVQGGSSITQQLAKNLFLSNERTLQRKIKEAFLATVAGGEPVEAARSSSSISTAPIWAAAISGSRRRRISTSASRSRTSPCRRRRCSPACSRRRRASRPHLDLPAARARANEVLTNMVQAGFMTEGQVIGARRHPADVVENADAKASPDYFLDWAFEKVKNLAPPGDRVLTVRTTIDMSLQHAAEDSIEGMLRQYGDAYRVKQAALVVGRARRGGARHGRRARLWREPVQPRDRRPPPARLVVQGLRLFDGHDERLHARFASSRTRRSPSATGRRTIMVDAIAARSP